MIAEYNYTDASGTLLLYQVQRFNPKDFRQRRPDGKGGWITTRVFEGITRVPYRWADLTKYPDGTTFIAEGEKDADTVAELGLCASTVAGGVWTREVAAVFQGRDIIILEDNDSAGREKAARAAAALAPVAKTVRISGFPELPERADVSDWIALDPERNNADALFARALQAPLWQPQADATSDDGGLLGWDAGEDDQIPPPRGWLFGNSFCRGFASSLLGDGGTGKTAVRYAQMLSLASDRALTGEHVFQRCRVLIISLEDGPNELRRRLRAARLHHKVEQHDLKGWLFLDALGKADGKLMTIDQHGRPVIGPLAAKLERTIVARKIDIVMLDPFIKSHGIAENDNSGIDEVAQIITDISIKYDIAVDVPHHMAKGTADPGNANRGRGASSLKDALRLVRTVTAMTPDEGKAFGLSEVERRRLIRVDDAKHRLPDCRSVARRITEAVNTRRGERQQAPSSRRTKIA